MGKPSDVNTQSKDGRRPLDVAVIKGNTDLSRLSLASNARSGNAGMHILVPAHLAFLDILHSFVIKENEINLKTEDVEDLLHEAL
jgi:ankyrin repeat protein